MASYPPPGTRLVALDVPDAGPLHVLVVADDPLARAGLVALLARQADYAVADVAASDDDLAAALHTFRPDVVLWDLGLAADPVTDLAFFDEHDLPVVALLPDDALAADAWHAGARALLLRETSAPALATALVAARHGLVVLDPALAEAVLRLAEAVPSAEDLTPREAEVLALLAEGLPNKLIADRLAISEHTVKFHVGALLSKLGAHSRTEAVIRAARQGLLFL